MKAGECGYWTFVPYFVTTCGLYAFAPNTGPPEPIQHYNKVFPGYSTDFVSITNSNAEQVYDGATVFVYVDCANLEPIPCGSTRQQDAALSADGVALPRAAVQSALSANSAAPTETHTAVAAASTISGFSVQYPSTVTATASATIAAAPAPPSAPPSNNCFWQGNDVFQSYTVTLADDRSIDQSCGAGFLNKLRGRCGQGITNWGCTHDGDKGAILTFNIPTTCKNPDIQDALNAASQDQKISFNCYEQT